MASRCKGANAASSNGTVWEGVSPSAAPVSPNPSPFCRLPDPSGGWYSRDLAPTSGCSSQRAPRFLLARQLPCVTRVRWCGEHGGWERGSEALGGCREASLHFTGCEKHNERFGVTMTMCGQGLGYAKTVTTPRDRLCGQGHEETLNQQPSGRFPSSSYFTPKQHGSPSFSIFCVGLLLV